MGNASNNSSSASSRKLNQPSFVAYTSRGESGAPSPEPFENSISHPEKQQVLQPVHERRQLSVSNSKKEILSFKVWYPDDSTLRIQGRGEVDGSTADVDLMSHLRDIAVPM